MNGKSPPSEQGTIIDLLIDPPARLSHPDERRRSRLLSGFLLIMLVCFGSVDCYQALDDPSYQVPWYGYLFMLGAYCLNRCLGRFGLASWLQLMMFPVVIFVSLVLDKPGFTTSDLSYLVLGIMLASLLRGSKETAVFAGLNLAGMLLLPLLLPGSVQWRELITPLGIVGIGSALTLTISHYRDLQERDSQAELRAGREKYRQLVESTTDWLWEIDAAGVYTYASPQVEEILGYTPAEIIGKTPFDLMPTEEAERARIEFDALAADRSLIVRLRHVTRHKDGHHVTLDRSGAPILDADGVFSGYRGIDRDISEADRLGSELGQTVRLLQSVLDGIPDLINIIDCDYNIIRLNQAGCKFWGVGNGEPAKVKCFELFGNTSACEDCATSDAMQRREPTQVERCLPGNVWMDIRSYPVTNAAGEVTMVIEHMRDITARKQAQEERRRSEERLRQAEKLEAIGLLAGGVAHDFNNQLAGILGFADVLREELTESPELQSYADQILTAAERSATLTRQLLSFARKGKLQHTVIDAHELIDEVVELLSHSLDKRIRIQRHLVGAHCRFLGDPNQMQNALLNIAINARDAMPDGGELTFATNVVEAEDARLKRLSGASRQHTYALISIRDTGIGMDEDTARRAFEPFFTTKGPGQGTGLGLSAVYGIIETHEGFIDVESTPDEGTVVRIYLPLATATDREDNRPEEPVPQTRAMRIMLVDDEPVAAAVCSKMLSRAGHQVDAFEDCEAAVAAYRDNWQNVDLVLLDMIMPKHNGREVFHDLRGINPDACILLCSGFSLDNDARELLAAGAVGFLEKPFGQDELLRTLAGVQDDPAES